MHSLEKQVDDYCLQHGETSITIDERDSPISSAGRIVLGMSIVVFLGYSFLSIIFYGGHPNFSQYTTGSWLLATLLFCVIFSCIRSGLRVAFVRSRVVATREKILTGNTWFGMPFRLKTTQVSEISAIKLNWECHGVFAKHWFCVGSTSSANGKKPVTLFYCSKRDAAQELAEAVAEITRLPVQDIPKP
jgi:hypothetical protein